MCEIDFQLPTVAGPGHPHHTQGPALHSGDPSHFWMQQMLCPENYHIAVLILTRV